MNKILITTLALNLVSMISMAEVVYSNQKIGETTITSAGGTTIISSPNGTMILNNSADAFTGSWTNGMNVTLSRVLSGEHVPNKVVISQFEIKMNDGEELTVLALTADEQKAPKAERSRIVWERAAQICKLTKIHPYALKVETKGKWFKGMLIDLNQESLAKNSYSTYRANSNFSGTRYFSEITCSTQPRGY